MNVKLTNSQANSRKQKKPEQMLRLSNYFFELNIQQ